MSDEITPEMISQWILDGLDGAIVEIEGDGRHFFTTVIYDGFEGKSRVQRHQLVYATLGDKMGTDVHALSMKTLTPAEAQRAS